jgi:hypothetical protein
VTLALHQAHAAAADSGANTIAIISLVVSVGSLLVATSTYLSGGRQWRRAGPELAFDIIVDAYRLAGTNVVHRIVARMEVANVGRMDASLRAAELRGPWSASYVLTDITQGSDGPPMLQPTVGVVSDGIEFRAPDGIVRDALERPSEDVFADAIASTLKPTPETMVRGRVQRGDGKTFDRPRRTTYTYHEEPWAGS